MALRWRKARAAAQLPFVVLSPYARAIALGSALTASLSHEWNGVTEPPDSFCGLTGRYRFGPDRDNSVPCWVTGCLEPARSWEPLSALRLARKDQAERKCPTSTLE